jgi:hypothetical protein
MRTVQLRDHPLMSRHGIRNWPPRWGITPSEKKRLSGEVGILEYALKPGDTKIIIVMKLADQRYTADLMFDDAAFCKQIYELLQRNIGRSIEEIGDLDVSGTL